MIVKENNEIYIKCDKCLSNHLEADIYDSTKVHLKYKDLCKVCASSMEDIKLVIDEDSGFAELMSTEEINKLKGMF